LLSPGVDFPNILRTAFAHADPKSAKKYSQAVSSFFDFEIWGVKAAYKMLAKLTPGVIFIDSF
jgi:hypothetical protein